MPQSRIISRSTTLMRYAIVCAAASDLAAVTIHPQAVRRCCTCPLIISLPNQLAGAAAASVKIIFYFQRRPTTLCELTNRQIRPNLLGEKAGLRSVRLIETFKILFCCTYKLVLSYCIILSSFSFCSIIYRTIRYTQNSAN